jgi:outer membrane protein W
MGEKSRLGHGAAFVELQRERIPFMKIIRTLSLALLIIGAGAVPGFAQAERETSLLLGGGVMNFDLSGTGTTAAFTARVSREIGANFVFEGGVLFARPEQQFGDSTLVVPEVQLQYHFRAGRFTPYLGAGVGIAFVRDDVILTDSRRSTVAFAGGTRVSLNDRAGLFGEFRVRGFDWDFVGTSTDVVGGVVVRLGR